MEIKILFKKIINSHYVVFFIVFCVILEILFVAYEDHLFHIYFLDVGQGDSIFIRTPSNRDILIDGGEDTSVLGELAEVMPFWDRTIDMIISTHPDSDHLGGLLHVLERYSVQVLIMNERNASSFLVQKVISISKQKNTEVIELNTGDYIDIGGLHLDILWPPINFMKKNENQASSVVQGHYLDFSFLLTGDIESEQEKRLIQEYSEISSHILKLSHHGSKTGSSIQFLDEVRPYIAIISCGANNKFGHPADVVIERLKERNIYYLRTDLHGRIEFLIREKGRLEVTPEIDNAVQ